MVSTCNDGVTVMEIMEMSIYEKLANIQNEMNVPKNLFNKFGNYYYRNAETILECAKPICSKYRTTLTVKDEIVQIGERYYVKAIARLVDWDELESIENYAYARECEKKSGMDDSQLTGSCSSYARKYALNGLFNLDDVKDADTDEQKTETDNRTQKKTSKPSLATDKQINYILQLYSNNEIKSMLKRMKKESLNELTNEEASKMISARGGE